MLLSSFKTVVSQWARRRSWWMDFAWLKWANVYTMKVVTLAWLPVRTVSPKWQLMHPLRNAWCSVGQVDWRTLPPKIQLNCNQGDERRLSTESFFFFFNQLGIAFATHQHQLGKVQWNDMKVQSINIHNIHNLAWIFWRCIWPSA